MAGSKKTDQKPVDDPKVDDVADAVAAAEETSVDEVKPVEEPVSEAEASYKVDEEKPGERVVEKRSGFVPALLGGVLAAAIGFTVGDSNMFSSDGSDQIAALEAKLTEQASQIESLTKSASGGSELASKVDALTGQLAPITADLDTVKSSLAELGEKIEPLTARLGEIESGALTQGASPEATAAFEAELKKLQDSLAAQRAEVEKMVADAQALEAKASAEAMAAKNAAILSKLRGELDSGQPYPGLIADLSAGGVDVPEALSAPADKGVATLAELRESFEPSARAALADAREADKGVGLVAFLQRQTGARSVTPQDGDGPDAVLSRAQAALSDGDVSGALNELKSLPEAAKAAMADWEQAAQTRVAAVDAADALSSGANSN